ncbi:alkyl sulfatase dimerization domain-containing protein [uncultured Vibrio sp.]|uniref:alkyl/aryl-sulfatase n=1 Tax=uncultured Vibrio sp. TaxID=114054 RepID=UPI000919A94F|nr:alkyl sulfatase dimerization domain-containing protein [uncultured Vibrio sp.]OIQ24872.1 MAG: MBL fold metallo-hydrolase [Vibrio sp. MedPE-SWchi]
MKTTTFHKTVLALAVTLTFPVSAASNKPVGDISANGKPASEHTAMANHKLAAQLDFNDVRAFENNDKGLIAPLTEETRKSLSDRFSHLHKGQKIAANAPDTVNPSLWRQAQLNHAAGGLYQVRDGIYQVRGTDLSSASFIRSESGWIVYDVLLTKEAMAASLDFFLANVPEGGDLPVVAMIYSHSHADHFGGSKAIQERFPDVRVYAPNGFTKETIDENVLAGNAMSRRTAYQYGGTLGKASETGAIDAALANGLSTGSITLVAPDETFPSGEEQKFFTTEIDGLEFVFMDTAGTEAPAGSAAYIPSMNALWTGEMMYHGMHNVYTLRGAKVRDSLKWSKDINEMINAWGGDIEYLFGSHSSPIWGNDEIVDFMKLQRDNYGFVHNQTLRLANNGMVMQDIGAKINDELPESIRQSWHTNGYHGTYSHNARAVYNMYLGYFDMNPANLNPLPIREEAEKFVEYMGGADAVVEKARYDFNDGNYRFVSTALNKVVIAQPEHNEARKLLADSFEQQGYQAEGAGWRNIYLTGAQELRIGTMPGAPKTASPDVLAEMTVTNLLDYLAVQVVATKADETPFTLNINVPDIQEKHFVEMSHGNLNNVMVTELTDEADATLHVNKADLTKILLGETTMAALLTSGKAGISGDAGVLEKLKLSMVRFDDKFEIVPRPGKGNEVDANIYRPLDK